MCRWLICLCFCIGVAHASDYKLHLPKHDKWSDADLLMEGAYLTLHTMDWLQTRYIATHPSQFYESINPVLGKHPSKDKVDLWFLATTIAQPLIVDALPSTLRKLWIAGGITIEYRMVNKNITAGIRFQW